MRIRCRKSYKSDIMFLFEFEDQADKDFFFNSLNDAYCNVLLSSKDYDYSIVETLFNRTDDKYANDEVFESGLLFSSEMIRFTMFLFDCSVASCSVLNSFLSSTKEVLDTLELEENTIDV